MGGGRGLLEQPCPDRGAALALLVRPTELSVLVLEQLHVVAEGRAACAVSLKCGGGQPRAGPGAAAAAAAAATVTEETTAEFVAAGADAVPSGSHSRPFPACMMWRVQAQSACAAVSCADVSALSIRLTQSLRRRSK